LTVSQPSEWLANFYRKKKIQLFFFENADQKQNNKMPKTSEWVPCRVFREKKTVSLHRENKKMKTRKTAELEHQASKSALFCV